MGLSKTGSAFTKTIIFDSVRVPVREPFSLIIHKNNGISLEIFLLFLAEYNNDAADGGSKINLLVRIAL